MIDTKTNGKNKPDAASPAAPTHRIAAIAGAGFCRAGRRWPRDGVDVTRSDFTDEEWVALTAEPLLVVTAL